jgi:hypothetical protein
MSQKLIILLVIIISNAHAKWSSNSIELLHKQLPKLENLESSGFVTLWGGVKRHLMDTSTKGDTEEYEVGELSKSGELEVYTHTLEEKAPLTIFFPGIFGAYDGFVTTSTVVSIEKNKTHMMVIPNFLNPDYIEQGPKYKDDPSAIDIQIAKKIIKSYLQKHQKKITKVHLVGESLGSYVAAGMIPEFQKDPVLSKYSYDIMLAWPPMDLRYARKNIDDNISKNQKLWDDCYLALLLPRFVYHFLIQETPEDMPKHFHACMNAYMFNGVFVNSSKKAYDAYVDANDVEDEKEIKGLGSLFKNYNQHMQKMLDNNDPRTQLGYWLKQRHKDTKVRIISSENDFVNDGLGVG